MGLVPGLLRHDSCFRADRADLAADPGFRGSDQGYCYLEDLYVHAEARGGGIGRALIGDAIAQALSIGASRVYWSTKHDNHAARRLYDSLAHVTDYVQYSIELDH